VKEGLQEANMEKLKISSSVRKPEICMKNLGLKIYENNIC